MGVPQTQCDRISSRTPPRTSGRAPGRQGRFGARKRDSETKFHVERDARRFPYPRGPGCLGRFEARKRDSETRFHVEFDARGFPHRRGPVPEMGLEQAPRGSEMHDMKYTSLIKTHRKSAKSDKDSLEHAQNTS